MQALRQALGKDSPQPYSYLAQSETVDCASIAAKPTPTYSYLYIILLPSSFHCLYYSAPLPPRYPDTHCNLTTRHQACTLELSLQKERVSTLGGTTWKLPLRHPTTTTTIESSIHFCPILDRYRPIWYNRDTQATHILDERTTHCLVTLLSSIVCLRQP